MLILGKERNQTYLRGTACPGSCQKSTMSATQMSHIFYSLSFFSFLYISIRIRGLKQEWGANQPCYLCPFTSDWIMRFSTVHVNGTACVLLNLITESAGMLADAGMF